jgi:hypothetical protein
MVNVIVWLVIHYEFRLMMEKYDGIRVYWDGTTLFTKNLRIIPIPNNTELLPPFPFEGELW